MWLGRFPKQTRSTVYIYARSIYCATSIRLNTVARCELTAEQDKKAQLTLSNPRDVKACQNCSNSTCFVSFHRIPFPQIANLQLHAVGLYSVRLQAYSGTQFEIRCLPIIKFLVQIASRPTQYIDYIVSFTLNNITLLLLSYTCFSYRNTKITPDL